MQSYSVVKKRILGNIFSLSSLEIVNYILPLITLPYLVRVLGPEKYGLVAFAQAMAQYFTVLTDYGFNMSATRNVSLFRQDQEKISTIFCSVTFIKFFFLFVSSVIFVSILIAVPRFRSDIWLYIFSFGMVFGNAIFPDWLFMGLERMKLLVLLNLFSKILFLTAIFIFIRTSSDYIYVPLLTSLSFLISGVVSIFLALKKFKIKLFLPSFDEIGRELKDGWHIFISKLFISLCTTTNTFILGLFANSRAVGYYAAGEKIIRALLRLFNPVFQALYPYFSKIALESKKEAENKLYVLLKGISLFSIVMFLFVFIFSRQITVTILGKNFVESINIIQILALLIIINPLEYVFANLALLPFRLDRYFSRIYIFGGIFNVALLLIFVLKLNMQGMGAAIASLSTETLLLILMYLVLKTHKIQIFGRQTGI
jgi:PST family polysaccharide transporter